MRRKLWAGIVISAVVASGAVFGLDWNKTLLTSAGLNLNMAAPDAVIRSKSLSKLPADLLRVPLLHDLLTEDFLFYYENTEGRLGLSGAVRRIAYEHDVTLTDELIKLVMDEPADVAFWRSHNGTLKYYVIAMTRNKLAKLLEPAAKIALKDKQLTMVGEISIEGDAVQLFALEYAWNRKLLLASHADRVVVYSDPGMLLNSDGEFNASAESLLNDLLGSDKAKQSRFAEAFDLDAGTSDHSIAIKADFLSFSYQHFFPALKALRFDFSEKTLLSQQSWSTSMLLDVDPAHAATLYGSPLWSSVPFQPSMCVAMPVDWSALMRAANSQTVVNRAAEQVATQFGGNAAVCWYASSRLHTPLFVTQLGKEDGADAILGAYFNYSIKASADSEPDVVQVKPVTSQTGDVVWQSERATLGRNGKLVYFSPDASLVEQALAVSHKRQLAVSDSWPDSGQAAVAVVDPKQLAQMVTHEVDRTLPPEQDEVLRGATDQHLLPKLEAVKKYPPMRLEMHSTPKGAGWIALDWQQY